MGVTESQQAPILTVTPVSRDVADESGSTTFNVSNTGTGTMPWTASVTSGESWLSITSGGSGSDGGAITCTFTANTGSSSRSGTIRVTATGAAGTPVDVTVTQTECEVKTFYADLDGDTYGDVNNPVEVCVQQENYVTNNTDCNDNDNSIYPGAPDAWYDGIDSNCDGVDDYDQDGDGYI